MRSFLQVHGVSLTRYLKRNNIMPKRGKSYPCLCEISQRVLLLGRISGILPVKAVRGRELSSCYFATPSYWVAYSAVLQIVYFGYFCYAYSIRWSCSQDKSYKDTDWYLMTVGYLIADLDSMIDLLLGSIRSKRFCRILERLSKLDSSITKDNQLKTNVTRMTMLVLLYLGIKIFSVLHSYAFVSSYKPGAFSMDCSSLDSTVAVLVRGLTVIFPTIEIAIVYMLVVLIESRFEYLADSVALTIESMSSINATVPSGLIQFKTPTLKEEQQLRKEETLGKVNLPLPEHGTPLERLTDMHQEIFNVVGEVNYCIGPQLLIGNCASLYTMIYYLYRYITFTIDNKHRARSSKVYYVISFIYRLTKVIGYMILGQRFHNKSLLPLKTLQKARIINLPAHFQQQLQTLMMQWNGKKAYLSACGIVNFGLWLLAPIAGNIITYLLVALQFDDISVNDANATSTEL